MIADNATLGYVATACARGGDLDSALTILRRMTEKGMSAPRTYNLVLLAIANGKTGTQPPPAERCVVGRGWTATDAMVLLCTLLFSFFLCILVAIVAASSVLLFSVSFRHVSFRYLRVRRSRL